MSWLSKIFGGGVGAVGQAVQGVSEVFVPNATKRDQHDAEAYQAVQRSAAAEFAFSGETWFDRLINGLNRLPRPMLALGTMGLFVFAMIDPESFIARMRGLAAVPEPLWWILGSIIAFYFGARETHYARMSKSVQKWSERMKPMKMIEGTAAPARETPVGTAAEDNDALIKKDDPNPILDEWVGR